MKHALCFVASFVLFWWSIESFWKALRIICELIGGGMILAQILHGTALASQWFLDKHSRKVTLNDI